MSKSKGAGRQGSSLVVLPSSITVPLDPDLPPSTITLQHMAENMYPIFYKVRRAEPKVVSIRPTRGVLEPGLSVTLQVTLKNLRNVRAGDSAKVAFKSLSLPVGKVGFGEKDLDKIWEESDPKDFSVAILKVDFVAKEEPDVLGSPSSVGEEEDDGDQEQQHERTSSVSFGPTVIFNKDATVETVDVQPTGGGNWRRKLDRLKTGAEEITTQSSVPNIEGSGSLTVDQTIVNDDSEEKERDDKHGKKGSIAKEKKGGSFRRTSEATLARQGQVPDKYRDVEARNELDELGDWAAGSEGETIPQKKSVPVKKEKRSWFGSSSSKKKMSKDSDKVVEEEDVGGQEDDYDEDDKEEEEEDEEESGDDDGGQEKEEKDEPDEEVVTLEKRSWFSSKKKKEKVSEKEATEPRTVEQGDQDVIASASSSPKSKWGIVKKGVDKKEKKSWFVSPKNKKKAADKSLQEGLARIGEEGPQQESKGADGNDSVISLADASTTSSVKEKNSWFGRKKKSTEQISDDSVNLTASPPNEPDETSVGSKSVDESSTSNGIKVAEKRERKGWFGRKKKASKPDDDDASQVSQSSEVSQGSALSETSVSNRSASSSSSRWRRVKMSTWAFGRVKKSTDEASVASHNSEASASVNVEESAIVKLTKDIASTPVKAQKSGKRGWFSSGKKKVAKKAKGEEDPSQEITSRKSEEDVEGVGEGRAPTTLKAKEKKPKKSWFGSSSRKKEKSKSTDEDEGGNNEAPGDESVATFDEKKSGRSVSFSEHLSDESSIESPVSQPKAKDPPILNVKTLSNGSWRLSFTNCDLLTQEAMEKYVMQVVDSSESGLVTSTLSELSLTAGELHDIHFIGGYEDDLLMWPNLFRLEVTNVGIESCGSTFSHLQNLQFIDLSNNRLTEMPKFETPFLRTLVLSYNYISEVRRVDHLALEVLDISHNSFYSVSGLKEIVALSHCLYDMKFEGNPIAAPYRNHILSLLPDLKFLDGHRVEKGGYGTPTRVKEHFKGVTTTPTDFDASRYSKHGRNNIRMLRKFMADDQQGDLARFLRDISTAKAKAKARLQDERARSEAEEAFYKLQREKHNTNAALSQPPPLPAEQDRSWAKTPEKLVPRDKSPPRYLEVTASRARQIEGASATKWRTTVSYGSPRSDEEKSPLPYYATPKGERVFDDDERQKRSEKKQAWKGSALKPKPRNTYQASRSYVNAMNVEKNLLEENLRNALNVDGVSRDDEMLEGVMSGMGGSRAADYNNSYFTNLSKPKNRADKRDDAVAKRIKYERRKSELLLSMKPIEKETLVKPRKVWKRIDGQIMEVKGERATGTSAGKKRVTVLNLQEERARANKKDTWGVAYPLSEKQRESVSRLYKGTPKHWERSKPKVHKNVSVVEEGADVSAIQNVEDTSSVSVKTPVVPRGFGKKVEMLKRGRELEAERSARRKKSMMLYDAGKDHDMFNKLYNTMSTADPANDDAEAGKGKKLEEEKDPMKGALDAALDRLIEIQERLIETTQLNSNETEHSVLKEEQALLEEFVLENSQHPEPPREEDTTVASLLLSPDVERTLTLERVAAKTPQN